MKNDIATVTHFIYSTSRRLAECQVECTDIRDGIGFSNADYALAFSLIANQETAALAGLLVVYRQQAGIADQPELFADVCEVAGINPDDYKSARSSLKTVRDAYRGRISWMLQGQNVTLGGYKPSEKARVLFDFLGGPSLNGVWAIPIARLITYLPAFYSCMNCLPGATGSSKLSKPTQFHLAIGSPAYDAKSPMTSGLAFWSPLETKSATTAGVQLNIVWERRMGFRQSLRRKGNR